MPRQARLDAPGLLHHVMARGLDRQRIFASDHDRDDFLGRVPPALERSPNQLLAWALMPNHVHFLIRSGPKGIAPFFRRLFTGYAMGFNQRHRRVGYLFQGRYKSIVCDEEAYFLTLVRYIHLNPVVGGVVRSLAALSTYRYAGHSTLMGSRDCLWQEVDEVLGRFGKTVGVARRGYARFIEEGLPEVRQVPTDLLGGGLMEDLRDRRHAIDRNTDRDSSDDRVLGEQDFVQRVWDEVEEQQAQARALKRRGIEIRQVARRIAKACRLPERALFERDRRRAVSAAKAALIFAGIEYLGKTTQTMAAITKMSVPAASKARLRGASMQKHLGIKKLIS